MISEKRTDTLATLVRNQIKCLPFVSLISPSYAFWAVFFVSAICG
jgi:hypothetical protein